jgi:gag-polypeptide of LTR copia-type
MILIEWSLVDTTTTIMSSKDIAFHIPMFVGQDFRFWKESMTDYLGAQRLLGYALGQRQRPVAADVAQPTQAELTAQADWDKIDLQVCSMISMRLSTNLRTLIGTTSMATWTNLEQRYGVPHFTGIYKDYELAHSIKLMTGENPEIRIQKIWTILERLRANGCILNNYLQGMLLLKAIPKEWDTIAQMYCNGMQMANVTFDGVRDAIMAEFERTARPAQLAHQADKISAVKHKGASPRFKEQRKNNSAPRPATDAPQGESSSKRTRKGGKREKAHKARAAHNIVSSAFVPVTVLNRMQESHYTEAGPSTSCVEEVVEPPAPTPVIGMKNDIPWIIKFFIYYISNQNPILLTTGAVRIKSAYYTC